VASAPKDCFSSSSHFHQMHCVQYEVKNWLRRLRHYQQQQLAAATVAAVIAEIGSTAWWRATAT